MLRFTKKGLSTLTALTLALTLGACSSGNTTTNTSAQATTAEAATTQTETKTETTTETNTEAAASDTTVTEANAADLPFSKYDPGITINVIRTLDDTTKFMAGEDINNNAWATMYKDELGITLNYTWTASTSTQYDEKLNVNIASGQLPDMMQVNRSQMARLAETTLINKDLQGIYDQYASPFLKSVVTQEGTTALDSATFGGKLIAIPNTGSSIDSAPMLWIRDDWLKAVGKSAPKTMDELYALMDEFMNKKPGGDATYYGMAMQKDLVGGFGGIDGFCNGFGAYPGMWIDDGTGKLVQGSYQPAMKEALLELQKLYAAGKIDPEFAVKDGGKESELCASGQIGIEYGQMWNPLWPLQTTVDNNNDADWVAYPLPTKDGVESHPQIALGTSTYFVINAKYEHPEALLKMQNQFVKRGWDGTLDDYTTYFNFTKDGTLYETFKYSFAQAWPARKNLDTYYAVTDAMKINDTSKLNPEQMTNYITAKSYDDGDPKGFGMSRIFGPMGSFRVIDQYFTGNMMLMNAFYGADTPTMTTKAAAINKLEIETFTKIIMGDSIDSFDTFVKNAMSLGGQQIQDEVNAWYATVK